MTIEAELEEIDRPVSADKPCGEDLEDTQLLASFDAFRLFGQSVPLPAETDWRDIKAKSLEAIKKKQGLTSAGPSGGGGLADRWLGRIFGLGARCRRLDQDLLDRRLSACR